MANDTLSISWRTALSIADADSGVPLVEIAAVAELEWAKGIKGGGVGGRGRASEGSR